MYKVSELAKLLNVARSTVYRCITIPELQQHVSERDNIKYINDTGYRLLKERLGKDNTVACETVEVSQELQHLLHATAMQQLEIDGLKRELQGKQQHVDTLEREVERLHELLKVEQQHVENGQILLRQEKEKVLLLEASTRKSLWTRLFKPSM